MQTGMSTHIKTTILIPSTRALNLSTLFLQKHHYFLNCAHLLIWTYNQSQLEKVMAPTTEKFQTQKKLSTPQQISQEQHHQKRQEQQQRTLIPRDSRSATAASSTCFLRPMMAILAPWRPNWVAISKPIPDPPPVMSATLPCNTTFLNGDSKLPPILSLCKSFLILQILCNASFSFQFSPSTSRVT